MAYVLFSGGFLVAVNVVIHTIGLLIINKVVGAWVPIVTRQFGTIGRTITITATVLGLFGIHFIQVMLWAIHYYRFDAFPTFEFALYFSLITFTTLGYGDVIIGEEHRVLAGLEGMNGFLLIGWSTAYLVAVSTKFGPFEHGKHF